MKKIAFLTLLSLTFTCVFSQSDNQRFFKEGWSFGALPSVTFDSDLGFQYGALINLYDFGNGERYPEYNHSLYFEASRYTKGSSVIRFNYDSDQFLKSVQTSVDLSYLVDQAYDFYGFNGYDAVFNEDWIDDEHFDYRSRVFYKYQRKMFRFKVDLLGNIGFEKFKWIAGVNFLNFNIGSVDIDKLNKGKSDDDLLPNIDGLYDNYINWGIISETDADGGFVPAFKGGLAYDSRDNKTNPMKGIWSEVAIVVSPKMFGAESSFSKLNFTHRQYFTLIPRDLSFAYRLIYQTTLGGNVPFYYQSQVITSAMRGSTSEGLGGSKTLRGIKRNRIIGDGFVLGNAELRWKAARFKWRNNNFYLGLNGFIDLGHVTKKIEFDNRLSPTMSSIRYFDYFEDDAEDLHTSYGLGVRIAMNQNFIVAIDYGIAADERDGGSGFYMGMNYLF